MVGSSTDKAYQNRDTAVAVRFLRERFPDIPIIGPWIDDHWTCRERSAFEREVPGRCD